MGGGEFRLINFEKKKIGMIIYILHLKILQFKLMSDVEAGVCIYPSLSFVPSYSEEK